MKQFMSLLYFQKCSCADTTAMAYMGWVVCVFVNFVFFSLPSRNEWKGGLWFGLYVSCMCVPCGGV